MPRDFLVDCGWNHLTRDQPVENSHSGHDGIAVMHAVDLSASGICGKANPAVKSDPFCYRLPRPTAQRRTKGEQPAMTSDLSASPAAEPARPVIIDNGRCKRIVTIGLFASLSGAITLIGGVGISIATAQSDAPVEAFDQLHVADREPISPLPLSVNLDQEKVQLGRRLFADSRLSSGNGFSCASCHQTSLGMTDGRPLSSGLPNHEGVVNTLTILNVGFNTKFSWNGQTPSLEEQADRVVESQHTMGGQWAKVLADLSADGALKSKFDKVYPDGLTRKNIVNAIVEYEKSVITPNSLFDRYLRGDTGAIGEDAKAGYKIFKEYGCISCHQGLNVGGNMLQVFGIFGTPTSAKDGANTAGAAQGSGIADDKPVFRVPSLRNVAETAPYFHDGSVGTLPEAISLMAKYQLGREISDEDVRKLESFLRSLSGEMAGPPAN